MEHLFSPGLVSGLVVFFQVLMIDLTLAGDNAVAVGLAASGLPQKDRRRAIVLGLAGAVVMLIGFALVAVKLLTVVGLQLAGGLLLLWICWKMWRDLRAEGRREDAAGEAALEEFAHGHGAHGEVAKPKTLQGALLQILLADLSMSLDNVLAVAGAAREHPGVMIFGLLLSITLMGVAATWIAKLLQKNRWIGYIGLAIVLFVSIHMIWEGHRQVAVQLGKTAAYNAVMPAAADIKDDEVRKMKAH